MGAGRHRIWLLSTAIILIGCGAGQQSAQGQQLDRNYATDNGVGTRTTAAVKLPHGRYTLFAFSDPPDCLKSVSLIDQHGHVVLDDSRDRSASAGSIAGQSGQQMVPTMVQEELQAGTYRLNVQAKSPGCAWRLEQILNYILSEETPMPALAPAPAPHVDVTLDNFSPESHFHLSVPGIYHVAWGIYSCGAFTADIIRADGGSEHLGDSRQQPPPPPGSLPGLMSSDAPMFLGAGDWTAAVKTACRWQIKVTPWKGSTGGGGAGFAG